MSKNTYAFFCQNVNFPLMETTTVFTLYKASGSDPLVDGVKIRSVFFSHPHSKQGQTRKNIIFKYRKGAEFRPSYGAHFGN